MLLLLLQEVQLRRAGNADGDVKVIAPVTLSSFLEASLTAQLALGSRRPGRAQQQQRGRQQQQQGSRPAPQQQQQQEEESQGDQEPAADSALEQQHQPQQQQQREEEARRCEPDVGGQ